MTDSPDRDLQALFRAEKAHDERSAPGFGAILGGRRKPASRLIGSWRFAGAVAAVALLAVLVGRLTKPQPLFAFTPGDLRVPTDYLLDIAHTPRAGEIPQVGTVDWFPLMPSAATRREQ